MPLGFLGLLQHTTAGRMGRYSRFWMSKIGITRATKYIKVCIHLFSSLLNNHVYFDKFFLVKFSYRKFMRGNWIPGVFQSKTTYLSKQRQFPYAAGIMKYIYEFWIVMCKCTYRAKTIYLSQNLDWSPNSYHFWVIKLQIYFIRIYIHIIVKCVWKLVFKVTY